MVAHDGAGKVVLMHFVQRFYLIVGVALILFMGFPNVARADMEGRMPFAHVQYNSAGLDNSGAVRVDVFQDKKGIYELKVFAFGTLHTVTKAQLGVINGNVFNAVGVSYSRGYPNVGGRTVYVLLYQVFSSGAEAVAMVVIREHGNAQIVAVKSTSQ